MSALEAVDGVEYLINVAKKVPRIFCALLRRVLSMTAIGDPIEPIRYEVTLTFGQSEDDRTGPYFGGSSRRKHA